MCPIATPVASDNQDWATNAAILTVSLIGRLFASKQRAPRLLWSSVIVGVPASYLFTTIRLDANEPVYGHR